MRKYIFATLLILCATFAQARDNGQWENSDPAVKEWYRTLMRPDVPDMSCCGEADAYYCDIIHIREGKTYCTITDDRDDAPLRRPHIDIGTEILIPPEKLKYDRGNPTGHSILFVGTSNGYHFAFCFVQTWGG